MVQRRHVVRYLLDVIERHAGRLVVFKQEQAGERKPGRLAGRETDLPVRARAGRRPDVSEDPAGVVEERMP
jgi:hypothetical protein